MGGATLGEVDFGNEATAENDSTLRWLDAMLHDRGAKAFMEKPVRIFVMGINRWRDENEWPLARARAVNYYLQADGGLSERMPGEAVEPDAYVYDPADPVPTVGGNHSIGTYNPGLYELAKPGPYDQRDIEARDDVLVYRSEVLTEDTEVTGHVVLKLYAASSAVDTDFMAKLIDVHPDGRAMNVTEGVIRTRFREDVYGAPKLMNAGEVYAFTIDMQVTSMVFKKGHRIGLDITSSNFPLHDRNLNTGDDPATGTRMATARQTVFHDAARASCVVLPVVPE